MMIGIIRLAYICENVYFSCDPFTRFPTGEISARLRALVLFNHHAPPILMMLDVYGSRRTLVLCIAIAINLVVVVERLNNIPGYNTTYAIFLIGCCWLRIIVYVTSIFDEMAHQEFASEVWLILLSTMLATYACSKYMDRQHLMTFGVQLKSVKTLK